MITFLQGDVLETLPTIDAKKFRCCATSPPYYGLRDYGHAGQIGLEETPAQYIAKLVTVFREVRRTLADDGTLWLNLGDSYAGSWGAQGREQSPGKHTYNNSIISARQIQAAQRKASNTGSLANTPGLKNKDLMGIPWRVAFALQADGWFLRSALPWIKRNCMPESVTDRPTSAVEYVFILSKSEDYHYNPDAIAMPATSSTEARMKQDIEQQIGTERANGGAKTNGNFKAVCGRKRRGDPDHKHPDRTGQNIPTGLTRNRRNSDWFFESWQGLYSEDEVPIALVVNPKPFREAHFATWPEKLVEPMILAATNPGDEVLDPFGGSGTTGKVALELGRRATLCELNPDYLKIARQRCETTVGLGI
jgi:DNA modification methylase